MGIILLVLLLALILGGLGFVLHVLWWIALVVLVVWLLGFLVRMGEGTSRGRWYRWCPAAVYGIDRIALDPLPPRLRAQAAWRERGSPGRLYQW